MVDVDEGVGVAGGSSHDGVQNEMWWAHGPPDARCARLPVAALSGRGQRNSENITNITAPTTPPLNIHNGSRSRSPRGYALCVSIQRAKMGATATDSVQLLEGLQEAWNGKRPPNLRSRRN
jgi:hypothetical protein